MSRRSLRVGAIEAGGTKVICAVGTGPEDLEVSPPIPTRGPRETLSEVISFFAGRKLSRIGIGSFGPIDRARGVIANTSPKVSWRGTPFKTVIERALNVGCAFDTDVNAAALGEQRWGAGQGIDNFVYLTVGTGIGGGAIVNGQLVHGLAHPEMGHIRVGGNAVGICTFHPDCLEGHAGGPAIARLSGNDAAAVIAKGIFNIACVLSPKLVILGGGVMKTKGLMAAVRSELRRERYIPLPKIVRPKLGDRAGVLGAIALAQEEFSEAIR